MIQAFERFDADKNGTLDGAEWNTMWNTIAPLPPALT